MTRRSMEDMPLTSPSMENDGSLMSPAASQASPVERSPNQDGPDSPAMLATMTPVNVIELKKEMEEENAIRPLYSQVKTEVIPYDKDELYAQTLQDKNDTPIDLIYEDGNKTVIYATAFDQKSLEIYSAENGGEITINNLSGHQIQSDGLIDGHHGAISGADSNSPTGTVSVVLQSNQGILQYPQSQVPTVLVLSEMTEDDGVPVIGLRASSQAGSILTSQLKATNGLVGGAGLELAPPQLSSQDLQGLFINQHVGYAGNAAQQNFQLVKREPEDLSHHRKIDCESPNDNSSIDQHIANGKQNRHKVVLVSTSSGTQHVGGDLVVDVNSVVKDELHRGLSSPQHGSRSVNATPTSTHSSLLADGSASGPIEFIGSDGLKPAMYATQIFAAMGSGGGGGSGTPSPTPYSEHNQSQYGQSYGAPRPVSTVAASSTFAVTSDPYYREYFTTMAGGGATPEPVYAQVRQPQSYEETTASGTTAATFVERYVRQSYHSKGVIAAATAAGLTVDLPSPDSGIGADAITPRDQNTFQQNYEYPEICPNPNLLDPLTISQRNSSSSSQSPGSQSTSRSRPWHDFGRQNDADKIQIPKIFSATGFKYQLETPISTSQRREDDRITYINKGQFYGITLDYIPDPEKQLKSQTVKSIVMLMFREEKSPEDEIKAWQFWHGRQHSVKQRILDADTKNSVGLVGCIEEVAHNAIAIYWNPLESPAKINIAVQCLSTDFSSQKGVKGLPLHLQIDTYEDPRDSNVYHRGYCQIKVFCDKGAERKTRDEERRAAKRKMSATGRKKLDELYHPMCERSEFYSMSDLTKPPVLFSPAEDIDKLTSMELQGFYGHDPDNSLSGPMDHVKSGSPFLLHAAAKPPATPTLKFHNHFPPEAEKKDNLMDASLNNTDGGVFSPPIKRNKLSSGGGGGPPPLHERVMLYVRQEVDDVYTPLHVVPPTTAGLLNAIENKYKISASSINNLYRKNRKGITAKIDDDMVAFYCNEDLFLLELKIVEKDLFDITFVELSDH